MKWAWFITAFFIIELWPGKTLSQELWAWRDAHQWLPWVIFGFWVLLGGHLAFKWVKKL